MLVYVWLSHSCICTRILMKGWFKPVTEPEKKIIGGAKFNKEMNQKDTVFITHRICILQSHKSWQKHYNHTLWRKVDKKHKMLSQI